MLDGNSHEWKTPFGEVIPTAGLLWGSVLNQPDNANGNEDRILGWVQPLQEYRDYLHDAHAYQELCKFVCQH